VAASEELNQLRRGELTEEQYFEARIAHATLHLNGRVSGRKLERIRTTLKRICASDPVLLAMRERVLRAKAKSGGDG
jgi:2'-5' RNA ligase